MNRGPHTLIDGANVNVHRGAKIGLIGANGSGKSSLFALIRGQLEPEMGECWVQKHVKISYIAQEVPQSEQSILSFVLAGHQRYTKAHETIAKANETEDYDALTLAYGELEDMHGAAIEVEAKRILVGLGFSHEDESRPVSSFSGGWKVRLQLAKTLIDPGELLLMDEPTNHLDLETIAWLEQWCKAYQGTLIIISHDIVFLDEVISTIWQVEGKRLHEYKGNYSTFMKTKAERMALDEKLREKQLKKKAHLESFVRRFKAKASKAKQAQSRVKQLEKMEIVAACHVQSPFEFEFAPVEVPNPLFRIRKGVVGYDKPLLSDLNLYLGPGDRIALLGKNGQGKSTMVKLLAGALALMGGEKTSAKDLKIGYFAQHQVEALDLESTPIDVMLSLYPDETELTHRGFLGRFNFSDDKAFTRVGVLSGGERARLAFALLVKEKPQCVLLDEPTNHLDLDMREALALALSEYNGVVVVVSHDRAFIERTTDEYYLINDGTMTRFDGSLSDYTQWALSSQNAQTKTTQKKKTSDFQQKRKLTNLVKKLESDMDKLNQSLTDLEQTLAQDHMYEPEQADALAATLEEQHRVKQRLQTKEDEWEEAVQALEDLS